MAKRLASPGYSKSALVNSLLAPVKDQIIEFKGLNRRTYVEAGEMADMLNLTSDNYPLLSQRKPRGTMTMPEGAKRPVQIFSRFGKICMIAIDDDDNVSFFYGSTKVTAVTGLTTSSRAVAINMRICFFPDKTCLMLKRNSSGEIVTDTYGSLEATQTLTSETVTISNEDARITLSNGHGFKYDDAVNLSGTLSYTPSGGSATSASCNISCVIEDVVSTNTIVLPRESFIELTGEGATSISLTGTISRTMPELDHIIEWNNRLWGCSSKDNTVYACKLGDPTNWQYFQATSLDSYYAEQGTDEGFTGVAEYSGHIIFFKPNSMCRIYGTAPSNYQVTNTKCFGVEDGSRLSVVTINDTVFYKSQIGIMAYQGSVPYCVSEKFDAEFKNVVAGTEGRKYYASCLMNKGESAEGELMVLDIDRGLWHKEDNTRFRSTCTMDNRLYYAYADSEILVCDSDVFCDTYLMVGTEDVPGGVNVVNPKEPTEDVSDMDWMAVFGPFDEYLEEKKIYSKLAFRMVAKGTCSAEVYISLDEGEWELVKSSDQVSTEGSMIPIIPRRCDRYSVKVVGKGPCEIKSMTRRVREGTFGRL